MLNICEIYDAFLQEGEPNGLSSLQDLWNKIIEERIKEEAEHELFSTK